MEKPLKEKFAHGTKNTKPFVSDPMMPGVDSFVFVKPLCSRNENITILFKTARTISEMIRLSDNC